MFGLPVLDILVIVAYFVVVIIIGIWSSRHIKSQEDYFLGGRSFGKLIQVFASFGMATSADNVVGTTVLVVRNGVAGIWQSIIWVFGLPIFWITSIWYRRLRVLTLGDFFEERYNSKLLAVYYALISAAFFMLVNGLGFIAMTKTITAIATKPAETLSAAESKEYHKALELDELEQKDWELLDPEQQSRMSQLRLENPRKEFSYINEKILMWVVAGMVIFYTVLGGLQAAFLADLLQGALIIILSIIMFPAAYLKINSVFGGKGLSGIVEITRAQLPEAAFEIWGSPAMVDFTWYYILIVLIMTQINVAVQANQLTACASAKDEYTSRLGFTTGIYIKRACTLFWGITALLLVILYGAKFRNPDYIWGYACRDLFRPLGFGLVGLIIACLMAAVMSTASALTLTTSALLTNNFVRPLFPKKEERFYVAVGRYVGLGTIAGAVILACQFDSVFQMMKILWEFNIIIAPCFWLGMKWRRANKIGAWSSVIASSILFVILPIMITFIPGVKNNGYLRKVVPSRIITKTYTAREIDVINREKEIKEWDNFGNAHDKRPMPFKAGDKFEKKYVTEQRSIFWTQDLKVVDDQVMGSGMLNLELVLLDKLGFDLSRNTYAANETIRLLIRIFVPFFMLIIVSRLTTQEDKLRLDKFFVRMKTPAMSDKEQDAKEIAESYKNPARFEHCRMFPNSAWEFEKLDGIDIKGIIWFFFGGIVLFAILYLLVMLLGK